MKSTSKMLKGFLGGGLILLAVFALVSHAIAQANKVISKFIELTKTSPSIGEAHAVKVWSGLSLILFLLAATFAGRVAAQSPGTWSTVAPMPTARWLLATATGQDGRIYAIGGYNGGPLNTVEAYSPTTNTWTTVAPMPTARYRLAAARGPDGRIYAIGGIGGAVLNTVEVYTPSTNSWATMAPMPTARHSMAAAAGPDGLIYAMGGGNAGVLGTVEAYSPITNSWTTVAPFPNAGYCCVGHAAATGPDGRIYSMGGEGANVPVSGQLWGYTKTTNTWELMADMPIARSHLAATTGVDGRIYAVGGDGGAYNRVAKADAQVYSAVTNTWSIVAPMPTARSGLGAAAGPDGRIYAIGGYNGAILNTVEALTVAVPPVALCKNVTVNTTPGLCTAPASVNNGSSDPNGGALTLAQSPAGPYPKGTTNVTLTVTDNGGLSASCTGTVTVVDKQPPTLTCPAPKVVECTGPSGTTASFTPAFSDNCPGAITGGCTPASGSTFPLGLTPISCSATDASANSSSCASSVRVVDTTPPVISSVSASPNVLWPPNHKMVPVTASVSVTDVCDPAVGSKCQIISVSSNEPVNGPGSGNTAPDWVITGRLTVHLRAERSGTGSGRIYTITVRCTDASGNGSTKTVTVAVPHDLAKK